MVNLLLVVHYGELMKNLIILGTLIFTLSRPCLAEDLFGEFQSNFSTTNLVQEVPNLKNYKVIILRGLFNNYFSNLSGLLTNLGAPIQDRKYAPFTRESDYLNSIGIETIIPPLDTQGNPAENGEVLAKIIKASDKPVIILAHSKGGVDALYGLTSHPEIQKKVAGWINYQVPFYGTKLCDYLIGNEITKAPLKHLLVGIMGGQWSSMTSLSDRNMKAFHQKNQEKVKNLVKNIPIISLASTFDVKTPFEEILLPLEERSAFSLLNRTLLDLGEGPNDGFTAVPSACLKGSECLVLSNIDHASLVVDLEPFHTFDKPIRIKIILSLLKMIDARLR